MAQRCTAARRASGGASVGAASRVFEDDEASTQAAPGFAKDEDSPVECRRLGSWRRTAGGRLGGMEVVVVSVAVSAAAAAVAVQSCVEGEGQRQRQTAEWP
jgi:hypothetical protein